MTTITQEFVEDLLKKAVVGQSIEMTFNDGTEGDQGFIFVMECMMTSQFRLISADIPTHVVTASLTPISFPSAPTEIARFIWEGLTEIKLLEMPKAMLQLGASVPGYLFTCVGGTDLTQEFFVFFVKAHKPSSIKFSFGGKLATLTTVRLEGSSQDIVALAQKISSLMHVPLKF